MPVPPKRYPKELYLKWQQGLWVLTTPRGKHNEETVGRWSGAKHPLSSIIEAAKRRAAAYPEGAELSIHHGNTWRDVEIVTFPPH